MLKLLIVDDEPLVQAGLKAIINWNDLDIELCGIAGNGQAAYELIQKEKADIVIADIRMPIMSGLELAKKCYEDEKGLPIFIMLTSYEDFQYAREALRYQVVDYLVKLELTPDILKTSVQHAIEKVLSIKPNKNDSSLEGFNLSLFQERFFIHLLNNLFQNEEEFYRQANDLEISFTGSLYTTALMEMIPPDTVDCSQQKQQLTLYNSTLQMFQEIAGKYTSCQVITLDLRYFAVIFSFPESDEADAVSLLKETLSNAQEMLFKYYNIKLLASIGRFLENPADLAASYRDAKQLSTHLSTEQSLLFIDEFASLNYLKNVFDMSLFRDSIRKAFDEFDEKALHNIFSSIFEIFSSDEMHFTQAMDAASNILHLALTLLSNGKEVASQIFQSEPDGYRSLYRQTSVPQVLTWLKQLDTGLGKIFREQKKDYKNYIVANVKKYVYSHMSEHITLQKVATTFSISPNYLSQLFKKNSEMGFNEYVTYIKIEQAKKLLCSENSKIYEVAEQLGFESAFYFSRVFKKTTGYSPKDYQNQFFETKS